MSSSGFESLLHTDFQVSCTKRERCVYHCLSLISPLMWIHPLLRNSEFWYHSGGPQVTPGPQCVRMHKCIRNSSVYWRRRSMTPCTVFSIWPLLQGVPSQDKASLIYTLRYTHCAKCCDGTWWEPRTGLNPEELEGHRQDF